MKEVTVNVDELREIVEENKEQHRQIFLEAQEGYRKHVIETLESRLEEARNGDAIKSYVRFKEPEDHTEDYERVLRMLELTVEDKIILTQQEFAQYVLDDWGWKAKWAENTLAYTSE